MRDFRRLGVWSKAHDLTLAVYGATACFPAHERFGLTDQLRRSAVSIGANIAEGCGREGTKEMIRYMTIAGGSASETEYHPMLARDLGYLEEPVYTELDDQVNQVKKMIRSLRARLRS